MTRKPEVETEKEAAKRERKELADKLKSLEGMADAQADAYAGLATGQIDNLQARNLIAAVNGVYKIRVEPRLKLLGLLMRAKDLKGPIREHMEKLQLALASDATKGSKELE